jgi:hypothetical protein
MLENLWVSKIQISMMFKIWPTLITAKNKTNNKNQEITKNQMDPIEILLV